MRACRMAVTFMLPCLPRRRQTLMPLQWMMSRVRLRIQEICHSLSRCSAHIDLVFSAQYIYNFPSQRTFPSTFANCSRIIRTSLVRAPRRKCSAVHGNCSSRVAPRARNSQCLFMFRPPPPLSLRLLAWRIHRANHGHLAVAKHAAPPKARSRARHSVQYHLQCGARRDVRQTGRRSDRSADAVTIAHYILCAVVVTRLSMTHASCAPSHTVPASFRGACKYTITFTFMPHSQSALFSPRAASAGPA